MVKRHFVLLAVFFTGFSFFDCKMILNSICGYICNLCTCVTWFYRFEMYTSDRDRYLIIMHHFQFEFDSFYHVLCRFFFLFLLFFSFLFAFTHSVIFNSFHFMFFFLTQNSVANFPSLFLLCNFFVYRFVKYHSAVDVYFVFHFIWIADCS